MEQDQKILMLALNLYVGHMEEIGGAWNGDLPGRQEDRAHQAEEIIDTINKLRDQITELDQM
jgi:hypothetical protein